MAFNMPFNMALVRTLHRWLAVIVGIQLIIWIVTGLYFNLISDAWFSPNVYKVQPQQPRCSTTVASLGELNLAKPATYIDIKSNAIGCYYLVHYQRVFQQYQAMDAETFDLNSGAVLAALTAKQAEILAVSSYSGPGNVLDVVRLPAGGSSNGKQQNPVWRVDFSDDKNTSVYIHDVIRQVIRHENDNYRFHKFMLTLHFMDYFNSGSFSHWLLKLFAGMALLLALTGVYWLILRIRNGQLKS